MNKDKGWRHGGKTVECSVHIREKKALWNKGDSDNKGLKDLIVSQHRRLM